MRSTPVMDSEAGTDDDRGRRLFGEVDATILNGSGVLFAAFEEDGRLVRFNSGCQAVTGVSEGEACRDFTWFDLFVPIEARRSARERIDALPDGVLSEPFESTCLRGRRIEWRIGRLRGREGQTLVYALGFDVTRERDASNLSEGRSRVAALASLTSGLAHELRNPLNAASLTLKLLERHSVRANDRVEMRLAIGEIQGELMRMASLLDEFLDFARPKPLDLGTHDLRAVVGAALDRSGQLAAATGVALSFSVDPSIHVTCDRNRVERALGCLLENAITAAGADGKVDVRLLAQPAAAVVEIWDDGPGLPPDARVFDPFFTTKPQGTGLGLSIVQRTAFDHGGRAWVHRRGAHTVFGLELPLP